MTLTFTCRTCGCENTAQPVDEDGNVLCIECDLPTHASQLLGPEWEEDLATISEEAPDEH